MRRKKTADRVNFERYIDPETGGDVMYQGEEVFSGRPHATEDAVKGFIAHLMTNPEYATDDELELGRMAAGYFQIEGAENPTHPLWDWVEEVVDDMTKRRHSSARKRIVGSYRVEADDSTALERYRNRSPEVYDVEDVEAELNPDSWRVDEHYWGLEATDGEITRVRLGNWSDAGWHWSDDGDGLLIFLWRLSRTGGDPEILEEFADSFPNPEFRRAIERTFKRLVSEGGVGMNEPLNSLAYSVTGDNAGWHFGGNNEMIEHDVEYIFEDFLDSDSYAYEILSKAFRELLKHGIRLSIEDIDEDELIQKLQWGMDWSKCSFDENQIVEETAKQIRDDGLGGMIDMSNPWQFMESARDFDSTDFLYEYLREDSYEVASECVYGNLEEMLPGIVEWAIEEYGEKTPEELEAEGYHSDDPRQTSLPLKEGRARFASAATAWFVKAARIPKEELRGFEFAMPVEFIYPDTGRKGFGRIMDFTRTPDGLIVSVAPHLYREDQEWFRRDPHDFVDVHIDNVFPTDKPFPKFIHEQKWPPKKEAAGYGSEMSAPMFRTTGQDQLSLELADEILGDSEMKGLAEVAFDMSSRQQTGGRWNVNWDELGAYLHDIYIEYGTAPELADPADWEWVAQEIYEGLTGKAAQRYVGSTKRFRGADTEENIAEEIVTDPEMGKVAVDVIKKISEGNKVPWDKLGDALQDVYLKGRPEEKSQFWAGRADWEWVAQHVFRGLSSQQQKAASFRGARRGDDLGRPRMHREQAGYKSKKKLFEWLDENDAPMKGHGDETFGKASYIFVDWPDYDTRRKWERKLKREGFKIDEEYWPEGATSAIRVSYFKGWHWDE